MFLEYVSRLNPFLESPSYILDSKSNILENKNLKNIKARFLANKQVYFILWTDIVLNHASCKTMEISIKCKQQWWRVSPVIIWYRNQSTLILC